MSSLRNAVQRRNHKERSQPTSRQKYGLLEKHKDYILRAKDFHSKQNRLKALREKAAFRNQDEFYFKMISTKTKRGVHVAERNNNLPADFIKLLKTQDRNYIKTQRDLGKKKIERLRENIHFLEEDQEDDKETDEDIEETSSSRHVIFVDKEEEVERFNAAEHFNTIPELVDRKFNRPTIDQLKTAQVLLPEKKGDIERLRKSREMHYRELTSRLNREENLQQLEQEINLQRSLMTKGRRKKVGIDKNGLPKYKWLPDRKK